MQVAPFSGHSGKISLWQTVLKRCPYPELFWFVFSRIRTEYRELLCISPYSFQILEKTDRNNSEYGHFSRNLPILYISYHFWDRCVMVAIRYENQDANLHCSCIIKIVRLKAVNYFCKKALSWMYDWVLNTPLTL